MARKPELLESAALNVFKTASVIGNKTAGWMVLKADGAFRWKGRGPKPSADHKALAEEICFKLNTEIWEDGFWQVVLAEYNFLKDGTLGYRRTAWCWFDVDNDMHIIVETHEPIAEIQATLDQRIEDGATALAAMRERDRLLEVRDKDKIKAALGEKSANPQARPEVDVMGLD